MSMQQQTQSKQPFPRIQPDMLHRLTQEAALRTANDDNIDWDDVKKRTVQNAANDQPI